MEDRRHSQVVHLAKVVSVRDLREQVTDRCPPDTPIPSEEYIRLQFLPRRKNTKTAEYYSMGHKKSNTIAKHMLCV